jgi:hypothetical protein
MNAFDKRRNFYFQRNSDIFLQTILCVRTIQSLDLSLTLPSSFPISPPPLNLHLSSSSSLSSSSYPSSSLLIFYFTLTLMCSYSLCEMIIRSLFHPAIFISILGQAIIHIGECQRKKHILISCFYVLLFMFMF